jgi:hypothetical protein
MLETLRHREFQQARRECGGICNSGVPELKMPPRFLGGGNSQKEERFSVLSHLLLPALSSACGELAEPVEGLLELLRKGLREFHPAQRIRVNLRDPP